jgi:hypothetical protein
VAVRAGAYLVLIVLVVALVAIVAASLLGRDAITDADAGQLSEPSWPLPASVPLPDLTDVTRQWGLEQLSGGFGEPMAGGIAVADMDLDGDLDLIIANGPVHVLRWSEAGYLDSVLVDVGDAMAVTAADVDADGWPDLLVARATDTDLVVWGGRWVSDGTLPDSTRLAGAAPSTGLLAAELSGDDRTDIVRLGLGRGRGEPDVLWVADRNDPRRFDARELPGDDRLSLAAELVDVDGDGLLDIWITRDVGWDAGGDSLFTRRGDPTGPWFDDAARLGVALEHDGMGLTVADLGGDEALDAYISDLGDNEVLIRQDLSYRAVLATGAARIRPPGASASIVSSSWASGALDLNLDGQLDLIVVNGGFPHGGMRNKIPGTRVEVDDSPAILVGIGDGRYVDVWPQLAIDWTGPGRGMTIADLDGDGDDDIVITTVEGEVLALRNDSIGPTLTVVPALGCPSAGVVVEVASTDGALRRLLAPHSFAGAHGVGVTVGSGGSSDISVTVSWPGGDRTDTVIVTTGERQRVVMPCPPSR